MAVVPFPPRPLPAPNQPRPETDSRFRAVALPIVGRLFGEDIELYVSEEEFDRLTGRPPRS